jgi:integrase
MKRKRIERGLYQQQNGTYGVYLLVDGKPRFKTVGRKLGEARKQRELLSAKAQRGELIAPTTLTFGEIAATWVENLEALVVAGERAERTLENYRYHLNKNILPAFGRSRVQHITTDDIAALISRLRARGLSAKTINGALVPLNRILNHSVRRGYITENPANRLERHERPRTQRRDQRVLDHQQIIALLEHADQRYRSILATAIYTGMRLNELLGLAWADVNLTDGFIHVRHQLSRPTLERPACRVRLKTPAATRDIPLLPQLGALLKREKLASFHSGESDYVFTTVMGKPLGFRNVERRALRRAAVGAGLNKEGQVPLRFHDLRHTFASHLIIDVKLDVAHVSRILGHTRPSVTLDIYTHLYHQAQHADSIKERMASSGFGQLIGGA